MSSVHIARVVLSMAISAAAVAPGKSLVRLADGIAPLVDHFNSQKDRPRLVAVLSPT